MTEPATAACAFGDPTCPCQDGDVCHYVDDPKSETLAMTPPATAATFDYEDENGSSHIKPCPSCGAGTDEPCADDCPMVTGNVADPALDLKMMSGWPVAGVTLDPRGKP